jgi:hypothetical protein
LVDFFGALMPGTLFLMLLFVGLLIPVFVLLFSIECTFSNCEATLMFIEKVGIYFRELSTVAHVAFFLLMLATSYVIGTVFYRRDPKAPDYSSFLTIAKEFSPGELETWVLLAKNKSSSSFILDSNQISKDTVSEFDVQFPYNNLKNYLKERGWKELSEKILNFINYFNQHFAKPFVWKFKGFKDDG